MKHRLATIRWAFSIAWNHNKMILVFWMSLIAAISILPAILLYFNRTIITQLDTFLATGTGAFSDILPSIVVFGVITTLIGVSNRVNGEFTYSILYDHYYFAMAELLSERAQLFTMEELLNKDILDEYNSVCEREGTLTEVISGICTLLGKFVGTGSLLAVAITLSLPVFIIASLYVIGVVFLNITFVEKRRKRREAIRDKERLASHYEELAHSHEFAKELRIFESKNKLLASWQKAYDAIFKNETSQAFATEIRVFVSGLGFYIFLAAMIFYSIFLVSAGTMTVPILLILFTLCLNIFTTINGIASSLMQTDIGVHAMERQYRLFGSKNAQVVSDDGETETHKHKASKSDILFEAKNLSYSYGTDKIALDGVSIKIKKGETIALVGTNGGGKTTLVHLLLQLYQPQSGNLFYVGKDYEAFKHGFLRHSVGAFFQVYDLLHMPIWENIGVGDVQSVNDRERISVALEKGGASSFVSKLPKGEDTYVRKWFEETGVDFSGGERQKLAVSRAHMSDKDILIFDEPASMLDPISELEQFMNIKEKLDGRTAILISHRVGFARMANRIILLSEGRVAEEGTHDELIARNGLYAQFFNEQAQWYQQKAEVV